MSNLDKKDIAGVVAGNIQSSEIYAENVKMSNNERGGHGFAGEKANHLYDKLTGKKAKIVGDDNSKNGADRLVNGTQIQTKFCHGGGKCISECFENGKFRYWNNDGSPMKIEVPKDFYADAKQSFAQRVEKDPKQFGLSGTEDEIKKAAKQLADETIKESPFTYAQAKNIAKFGTIESLTFDAVNGIQVAGTAMGLSAVISFATAIWSGEDFDVALKSACYSGLKVGGTAWITNIASSQIGRTGLTQSLRPATDWVVKNVLGNEATTFLANTLRASAGKSVLNGAAAANHLSKFLRGNVVTGVITVGVLSSADLFRLFQGRMSGAQVFKNVTNTAAGVAGGTGGWFGGASAGAVVGSAIPIIGTAAGAIVGGILGSVTGGIVANKASSTIMDSLIVDDSKEMQDILGKVFTQLAQDYLLNKTEADNILAKLQDKLSIDILRDMYGASSRSSFAENMIEPLIIEEVKKRRVIRIADLPTSENLANGIKNILDNDDENEINE